MEMNKNAKLLQVVVKWFVVSFYDILILDWNSLILSPALKNNPKTIVVWTQSVDH